MSVFKRVKTMFMADVHEALDRMENPIGTLEQYLREMEEQLDKAKHVLAQQLYLEKRYEQLVKEAEAVVAKRDRQAKLAVSRQEEAIAKLALQEKLLQESKLTMYREQYEATKQQTAVLYAQIDQLREKHHDMQYKKLVLVSRVHAAKAAQQMQAALRSFNTAGFDQGFGKAEDYVQRLEAQAAANTYFQGTAPAASLDLQEAVNRELEALKEKQ